MKNYYQSLVSLLIVGIGILSLTTAQPHYPTEDVSPSDAKTAYFRNWFEERCNRNGGPGAFESAMKLPEYMKQCMTSVVDIDELRIELETAGRRDNLAAVFKKYCKRVPELEKCLSKMSDVITPCFDPEERDSLKISDKMTNALLEYVCYNDGERITTFIATGGSACVQRKLPELQVCATDNFGDSLSPGLSQPYFDLSSHPMMNLNPEKCLNIENFKTCTVTRLASCPDPTTAIITEEMFEFVRKVTPCEELANNSSIATPTTGKPTDGSEDVANEQKTVDSNMTMEDLTKKNLLKQIEASEAQVRAANAQEKAAHAQEKAARVIEQVGETLLRKKFY